MCVDMMWREEQNAGGEEEKGKENRNSAFYKTQWCGNPYIPKNKKKKKALITQKMCRISAYVGMCVLNNAPPPRLYGTRCCTVYTVGEQGGRGGGGCRESTSVCRLLRMGVCERAVQQLNIRMHTNTERCT